MPTKEEPGLLVAWGQVTQPTLSVLPCHPQAS